MDTKEVGESPLWRDDHVALEPAGAASIVPLGVENRAIGPPPVCRVEQVCVLWRGNHKRRKVQRPLLVVHAFFDRTPDPAGMYDDGNGGTVKPSAHQQSGFTITRLGPGLSAIGRAANRHI